MPAHEFADTPAARAPDAVPPAPIRVQYYTPDETPTDRAILAAIHFGAARRMQWHAPLNIHVELAPLCGSPTHEVWFAHGAVHTAADRELRYAHDEHYLFAELELEESTRGLRSTAEHMYAHIQAFQQASPFPHLLRMWNYLDAINEGAGDLERYREFCAGRAHGLGAMGERFPAATAIGRQARTGRVQVFWLAAREAGVALENPRQVSAYRYPRVHGPVSPTFSRATVAPDGAVLISGTASIVGHASQHDDDPLEQLAETQRNLEALASHPRSPRGPFTAELMKVYVREPAHAAQIAAGLQAHYPGARLMCLAADICRRELLLEVEGVRMQGSAGRP